MKDKPVILVADDQPQNIELLEAYLVPQGYKIIKAEDGEAALKAIGENTVDLVLLDVKMPKTDGFEVCRRIKGDERLRNIPVIMLTALSAKEDRIKGIEAGAEDFISKPLDKGEVLARIRMLLRIKNLNDQLSSAYSDITSMIGFGETMVLSFDPLNYDFLPRIDGSIKHILRSRPELADNPEAVVVGFVDDNNVWQWYKFEIQSRELKRTWLKSSLGNEMELSRINRTNIGYYNTEDDIDRSEYRDLIKRLRLHSLPALNMACFSSPRFCIFALNYGKVVSRYDAGVVNSIAMQSLFLKSLASQVKETENAFDYLVHSLARAAEANDEDTGSHILRVGEYCAIVAKELGMSEKFTDIIRLQATLHDVGKMHVHPDILKKPGTLTPEEWLIMKEHTTFGAKILGDHVRLTLAKSIALSHHERWDGSGYPRGLKGEQIPVEGRIMNVADQYDALRNARVYKPTFDHKKAYSIITEGDGRTLPYHFDPQVLKAFKETASQCEEVYEKMKG